MKVLHQYKISSLCIMAGLITLIGLAGCTQWDKIFGVHTGSSGNAGTPPAVDLTGTWVGTFSSITLSTTTGTFTFSQTGSGLLSGSFSINNFISGTIPSGFVAGNVVNFSMVSTSCASGSLQGLGNADSTTLTLAVIPSVCLTSYGQVNGSLTKQ